MAAREGITPDAIKMRIVRGKYPGVTLERVGHRLTFVVLPGPATSADEFPVSAKRRRSSGFCDCSRPAVDGERCERCRALERRQARDFVSNRPGRHTVRASGLSEYACHLKS